MADGTNEQSTTPAADVQQPQRGTPTDAQSDSTAQRADSGEVINNPEAKAKADQEAAYRRKVRELEGQLKTFQDAQKAADDAKLGDLERAQKQLSDAQQAADTFRTALATAKLENAAIKANALDSDAIVALLAGKLTFGDNGQPENVDELLEAVKKAKPHLFVSERQEPKPPQSAGGATNPGRAAAQQAAVTQAQQTPSTVRMSLADPALWRRQQ